MPPCPWAKSAAMLRYHDEEWGVPVHDDRTFFEFLILEGAQAGLSWETILSKRAAYREAFDEFDPARVAKYTEARLAKILLNPGIVRNRLKVNAARRNARAFLVIQDEAGSFDAYIWKFVSPAPARRAWKSPADVPAFTPEAEAISKDLKRRGMTFVGPTILYAFMQATGLVNDHLASCPRRAAIASSKRSA